ncbi:hypothetical protein AGENTSMITH_191 [Bacillus phage vB_BspM_AgentSmith]|nr:hypothetical protein AGENTSMITH_191 [Bacillus phage vB_BspM_AgentSmith]
MKKKVNNMTHFVLELEVILTQQPVFKMSLPVLATTDDYEQKRNFRRALDNCKDGYVDWSNSQEESKGGFGDFATFGLRKNRLEYLLGEFGLVEEFINYVENLIEENINLPSGITYGKFIGPDLFYQVSVKEI